MQVFESNGVRKFGFTLIELLVVISIIAILSSITVIGAKNYVMRAHNSKRKANLIKFKAGMENFYAQFKFYPNPRMNKSDNSGIDTAQGFPSCSTNNDVAISGFVSVNKCLRFLGYMDLLPQDPKAASDSSFAYRYAILADTVSWEASAKFENAGQTDISTDCTGSNCDAERYEVGTAINKVDTSTNTYALYPPVAGANNKYVKIITIQHDKVGGNLTNYPMLFSVTDPDLKTKANGGQVETGYDIFFTDAANAILNYEIEKYDDTTGQFIAWIKVPSLSNTAETKIIMHYGDNSISTSQENRAAVWDANHKAVWHLPDGSSLTANDSTSNTNNGTVSSTTAGSGKIGGAGDFNGTSSSINVGTGLGSLNQLGNNFTIEAWIRIPTTDSRLTIFSTGYSGKGVIFGTSDTAGLEAYYPTVWVGKTNSNLLSPNTWYHVTYTKSGTGAGTQRFYVNGASKALTTNSANNYFDTSVNKYIGYRSGYIFNGLIDEVRISSIARSPEWILTEYNNQNSPDTFYSVGSQHEIVIVSSE